MGKEACNIQGFDLTVFKEDLDFAIDAVFGEDLDDVETLEVDLADAKVARQENKNAMELARLKHNQKKYNLHSKEHKSNVEQIKLLSHKSKEYDRKLDYIDKIKELIRNTVTGYKSIDLLNIDPTLMLEGMKAVLEDRFSIFGSFHDLDLTTLQSVFKRLQKDFATQAKNKPKKELSLIDDDLRDPLIVMMENDETGLGARFINKTKEYLYNKYSKANHYIDQFRTAQSSLSDFIFTSKKWFYNVSRGLTENEQLKQSLANTNEFVADVLDERTKYLRPMSVFILDDKGLMVFSPEFEANREALSAALNGDLKAGIPYGINIQTHEVPDLDRPIFYVSILQETIDHNGEEIWYTFEIPAQRKGEKNEWYPELYPQTKGGKEMSQTSRRWKVWRDYFLKTDKGMGLAKLDPLDTNPTLMDEGFYQAQMHKSRTGKYTKKGKEEEFSTTSYHAHRKTGEMPDAIPTEIWTYIAEVRRILKDLHGHAIGRIGGTTAAINRSIAKLKAAGIVGQDEVDDIMGDLLGLDLDSNMWVKDGDLISVNSYMSEKKIYFPHKRVTRDEFINLFKVENKLFETINRMADELADMEADPESDPEALTSFIEKLEEIEREYEIVREIIEVRTGQKNRYDVANKMQLQDTLQHARQRTGVVSPLPDEASQTGGRRGDFHVLVDYVNEVIDNLAKNELKVDMVDILARVPKKVKDYLVDQLRTTFGRHDARAAFPMGVKSFEYGGTEVIKYFKYLGFDITPETAYALMKIPGGILSGNLLGVGSAQQNSWQQVNVYIETGIDITLQAEQIRHDKPELVDEIVKRSGVMDVMSSIADSLLGSISGDVAWNTGYFAMRDLALFNLSPDKFTEAVMGNEKYTAWLSGLESRLELNAGSLLQDKQLIMNDLYEIVHKLREGTLKKADIKGLNSVTSLGVSKALTNQWVKWGLDGGWVSGWIKKSDTRGTFSFIGTEERMRRLAAVDGAVLAVVMGKVPTEWIEAGNDPYLHPEAIRAARIMVNKTMFGMSPEFHAKFLRGGGGQSLFKFVPYTWHQMNREWKWIQAWWDGFAEKTPEEKSQMLWDTMKIPSKGTVRNAQEERMSRFLWTRVLSSVLTVGAMSIPFIGITYKFMGQYTRSLYKRQVGRGLESMTMSLVFRGLQATAIALNLAYYDEEDEDEVYDDLYRYFIPIYFNTMFDLIQGVREGEGMLAGFKYLGIYSRSFNLIGTQLHDWYEDPPELF